MITRIYVMQKGEDSRANGALNSFNGLGLKGKVNKVAILDSYLINANISKEELVKSAEILTNKNIETYLIDSLPDLFGFSYVLEIGFLPGVTDNVARTILE